MYVPAGRTVQLSLDSQDVIHAFYVPQFLFKRDVVPGRDQHVRVQGQRQRRRPDVPRPVRRAVRLRPPHHALRRRSPRPRADFDAWLQKPDRQANAPPAPPPRAASGAERRRQRPARAESAGRASAEWPPRTSPSSRRRSTAPADTPFKIDFDNQDPGTPHNVAIHEGRRPATRSFKGEIFPGVGEEDLRRPGRCRPGTYAFVCSVHPNMTGTLTVQ